MLKKISDKILSDRKLIIAFTLAEAILTMTILGIIASVAISAFKPNQYRNQGYKTLKRTTFQTIDETIQTILMDCTEGLTMSKIYEDCNKNNSTHTFGSQDAELFAKFMRGKVGDIGAVNGNCEAREDESSLALKNNVCIYFGAGQIFVDLNGKDAPNDGNDQFGMFINNSSEPITGDINNIPGPEAFKCGKDADGIGNYWDDETKSCNSCKPPWLLTWHLLL